MSFISDKWRDSSVLTKVVTFVMALNTLLTLVSNILIFAVDSSSTVGGKIFFFLITTGFQALLTFGIFKVSRAARTFTILEGLCSALVVIVMIASWKASVSMGGMSSGLMGMLINLVWSIIPAEAKAIIGIFVLPYVLQILSMLILFFTGKDFAKVRQAKEAL
jgi:hypothetical protein